ncbi:uncharacterized protein LOC125580082 [Brassica napus]|uniref:uncharacterized protein LOC125580082 n=1 Tax=Brassica napus TaxID=3708 RepID=UPI0006AB1562|nr:uncharacterized protein LOC125580082 [Brassica napus]
MRIALKVNEVWETIDPGSKHEKKNNLASALIFQSTPEALTLQVGNLETAKTVWDAIQARHVGAERVREARLQTLMADFDKLKMKEEDSIDTFIGKLAEISSKTASLGEVIFKPKLVKKFLKKERISEEEEEQSGDTGKLMYASGEAQQEGYGRGRGRGGRGNWIGGRGRGRYGGFYAQREAYKQGQNRDKSHITCFSCDKLGHYASECPDAKLKLKETVDKKEEDTQEADELMMHEVVYLNERKVKPSIFEDK